jgi:NAD(P)-dependent dehydrogenase (short-subunit alcohol dehydrogenase family)
MTLADKVVVVTGGGGGIGRATAALFRAKGYRVVIVDVDRSRLNQAINDLTDVGGAVVGHELDVTDVAACQDILGLVAGEFGRLDVLVNSAGAGAFDMTVETTTEENWDRTIATNLKSVYSMSRAAIPHIRSSGGGAIVNVTSVHAFATSRGVAPYAAAKGAVLALTRSMAIDFVADRIRVVAVAPGAVDTDMLRMHVTRSGMTLDELGLSLEDSDLGRVLCPEEIAEVIVFAASDAAKALTGTCITADGGLLAGF